MPSNLTAAGTTNRAETGRAVQTNTRDSDQRLRLGDRISFRVLEDQEDPKLLTITDAGELDVPELGFVAAAGKTCEELAREIKSKLEQTAYFQATVIISLESLNKTSSGRRVFVVGQVRRPGPQELPPGEIWTLSRVILQAGGFAIGADQKRVRLLRAGDAGQSDQSFVCDVRAVLERGRAGKDIPVQPNDVICVAQKMVNF